MDDESLSPLEETRAPSDKDLAQLAARLNELGAKYIVIGGFAVITAGFPRSTMDIDLLIDRSPEKEATDRSFLRRLLEDRGEWPVV